jgi:hypothetical protein
LIKTEENSVAGGERKECKEYYKGSGNKNAMR